MSKEIKINIRDYQNWKKQGIEIIKIEKLCQDAISRLSKINIMNKYDQEQESYGDEGEDIIYYTDYNIIIQGQTILEFEEEKERDDFYKYLLDINTGLSDRIKEEEEETKQRILKQLEQKKKEEEARNKMLKNIKNKLSNEEKEAFNIELKEEQNKYKFSSPLFEQSLSSWEIGELINKKEEIINKYKRISKNK
jgi:hypothetical protein